MLPITWRVLPSTVPLNMPKSPPSAPLFPLALIAEMTFSSVVLSVRFSATPAIVPIRLSVFSNVSLFLLSMLTVPVNSVRESVEVPVIIPAKPPSLLVPELSLISS